MIELKVHNTSGAVVGDMSVDEAALGGRVRRALLKEAVLMYEAARRVGTASTKTRGEVKGSTRKLFRQKGTGRARMGSIRSSLRRGGGVVFGPKPRGYRYSMPKKARRLATRNALLARLGRGDVVVLDSIEVPEPKTKFMAAILKALDAEQGSLVVLPAFDQNVLKAARNMRDTRVLPAAELNAYELLKARKVVIARGVLEKLLEVEDK